MFGVAAPALTVTDLTHRFGDRLAVDHLNLSADPGEIVGLVGRNGAGKTTTMRAIMGIISPQSGTLLFANHPISLADRLHFGYMPEERGLYPQMRVLDQLVYFARLHGLSPASARSAALSQLASLGLRGRERDRVVALSHGNQQRVQLAVAIIHHPALLVLDEPFAGLDPSAVDTLSGLLRDQAKAGAAILFSSHQLDLIERMCDRVVILEQGRALAQGTLASLRSRLKRHLRVQATVPVDWPALPGVRLLQSDASGDLLDLDDGVDPQAVLNLALANGPFLHFGFELGGLSELYRELLRP